jgi:MYXO-CTERM domain-containing protein
MFMTFMQTADTAGATAAGVPEPAVGTAALLAAGLLAGRRRRRSAS